MAPLKAFNSLSYMYIVCIVCIVYVIYIIQNTGYIVKNPGIIFIDNIQNQSKTKSTFVSTNENNVNIIHAKSSTTTFICTYMNKPWRNSSLVFLIQPDISINMEIVQFRNEPLQIPIFFFFNIKDGYKSCIWDII